MEIRNAIRKMKKVTGIFVAAIILILFMNTNSGAQVKIYTVKDGKMYIELSKDLAASTLDSFIDRYDLRDLGIKFFLKTSSKDSLEMQGWYIEKNNPLLFAISKPLISSEDLTNLADKMIFAQQPRFDILFPSVNNGVIYGQNRFKNKSSFKGQDSVVSFYLRNYQKARSVKLAASFTNWESGAVSMTKTDSGWIANVKLGPGKYWYKFIVDGNWMVDDDNLNRENDDEGNINSVFFKTNYVFTLAGFTNAKKVIIAGSFNRWQPKELLMQRTATGWELPIFLAEGTHTYKFIVDDSWIVDPANPDRYPNEFDDYNSVIRLGKPYLFKLNGYENAGHVILTGSFNGWRKEELFMKKTASGWELPYTLGEGNYEYRFIVDKKEITDPLNPLLTSDKIKDANSYLILGPNYTFRLKGYGAAKKVFLAGDFNNFSPNALAMTREGNDWIFRVHLTRGKHLYKFIVDGKWIRDPENKLWEQNKYGSGDSVIWFGRSEY